MRRALIAASVIVITSVSSRAVIQAGDRDPSPGGACIAVVLPEVEGLPGNAADVAGGIRDLIVTYLTGPSLKVVPLESRLPSQAVEEAKQKACEPILFAMARRKSGGGRFAKAFGQAAGASSWYLPGGGSVASATARAAAAGGLQAVSSLAGSTKANDEMHLEYRLQSTAGQVQFGPKTETQKASADGEDVLTPVVMRAAEAIVTRKGTK
jgi:hypothetical protein